MKYEFVFLSYAAYFVADGTLCNAKKDNPTLFVSPISDRYEHYSGDVGTEELKLHCWI